jgi:hypothetical protein
MSTIQGSYKDINTVNYLDIAFADSTRAVSAEFYANGNGRIPVVLSLGCADAGGNDLIISSFTDAGLHIVNSLNNEIVPFDDNQSTWFISEAANELTSANYGSPSRAVLAPVDDFDPQRVIPVNSYVVYLSARDVGEVAASFYVSVTTGNGTVYSTSSTDFNYAGVMQLNVTGKESKHLNYLGDSTPSPRNSTPSQGGDFVFSRETKGYISSDQGGSANYYNNYLRIIDGVIAKVEFNRGGHVAAKYSYYKDVAVSSYRPYYMKISNKLRNGFIWDPSLHPENELVSTYVCDDYEWKDGHTVLINNGDMYKFNICREGASSLCLTKLEADQSGSSDNMPYINELYIYDQYGNRATVHFPMADGNGDYDIKVVNGPWPD